MRSRQLAKVLVRHVMIEKIQTMPRFLNGAQGWHVGASNPRREAGDIGRAQSRRMPAFVKMDIADDPMRERVNGGARIVPGAGRFPAARRAIGDAEAPPAPLQTALTGLGS